MAARALTPQTEERLFAELNGFVLTDPELLDEFHDHQALHRDLLELYTTSDVGDAVVSAGVAIPVLQLEPGYYSVTLRGDFGRSALSHPRYDMSSGWVLHVSSGEVVVSGVGYLKRWDPQHPKLRRLRLEPGWYSVDIVIGGASNDDDFALDFVLHPCTIRPTFSADIGWSPDMTAATV